MAAATDAEWRPAARDGDPVLRAENTAPGGPACANHPSRGCWVNPRPAFLCGLSTQRHVSSEHAGEGSLSRHLAGLGAMLRAGPAGVPRSVLRGPGVGDNGMGCPPAPLLGSWTSSEPLLSAGWVGGLSPGHQLHSLGSGWGPQNVVIS